MSQKTSTLKSRVANPLKHEKIRFGLVGVINTFVDFLVLLVLARILGVPTLVANVFSTGGALGASYLLNKKAVFRSTDPYNRRQLVLFIAGTLIGLWFLQTIVIAFVIHFLGFVVPQSSVTIMLIVAKIFATIVSMTWNYYWYSRIVFAKKSAPHRDSKRLLRPHIFQTTVAFFAVSIITLVIVMAMGNGRSVWFDEGYSIMLAQRPVTELVDLTRVDAHPPLYYLYLKLWGGVFGWSEVSLRLSSAVLSALGAGMMLLIIRRFFDFRTALIASPFFILAPFLIRYGYEIRMYAFVTLLGLIGTWLLIKARESASTWYWLGYVSVVVIGMYTLYLSAVIWIAHALWQLYEDIIKKKNPVTRPYWLYYFLAIILFLPWLPTAVNQFHNSALPPAGINQFDLWSYANYITLSTAYTAVWSVNVIIIASLAALLCLSVWILAAARQQIDRKRWSGMRFFIFMFLTPVAFYGAMVLFLDRPSFTERYMVHVTPYLYALIGIAVSVGYGIRMRWQSITLAVVSLGLFVYGLTTLYGVGNYNYQRLQPTYAKTIRKNIDCNETTFVTSGAYGYIDMWYDFQDCDFRYFQPAELSYVGGFAPMNKFNVNLRIKSMNDVTSKKIAFIYYDDSTEFMQLDSHYALGQKIDLDGGVHVQIYLRNS